MTSLDQIPISEINVSIRVHNALMRADCNTVGRLHRAVKNGSVWEVRNLGVKGVAEVEEKLEYFFASIGYSESNLSQPQYSEPLASEPTYQSNFDINLIGDLSLHLLPAAYISSEQTGKLKVAGIETIGELNSIFQHFQNLISPNQLLTNKVINLLITRLGKQIREGSLSADLLIEDQSLSEWLQKTPTDPQEMQDYILALKPLVIFDDLEQELGFIFTNLSPREEELYLKYHLKNMTLEVLGQEEKVTRERIRQIISIARTKILSKLSRVRLDYIHTALDIGEKLEGELSRSSWKADLQNKNLMSKPGSSKTTDRLFGILSDKNLPGVLFNTPENVALILSSKADMPVFVIRALEVIPSEKFREVDRIVKFTAGIQKERAVEILGCKPEELNSILVYRGLEEVEQGWFSIRHIPRERTRQPLLEAGLRMWQYCGPLEFGTFYVGLQRYISRHYDALTPEKIVVHFLERIGFDIKEGHVIYKGKETTSLSGAEEIALKIIDDLGPVVSFLELVNGLLEHGYSAASATTKVMTASAVVERIEVGFYKKRGVPVSKGDLEAAKARQEAADREPAISITADGKIRYQTTVNTWALGGVLSIGKLSEYLPDLSDGCPVYVGDKECGKITGTENLIWGLTTAFKELEVKFGDYIELEFDKRKQLKVQVNILQRRVDNPSNSPVSDDSAVVESVSKQESQLEIVLQFLRQLHERAKIRTPLHAKVKVGDHNYFGVSAGKTGLRYGYVVVMDQGFVNLYINNGNKEWNKDEYIRLFEHRTEIEQAFGEELEWHLKPDIKSSYIRYTVSGYDLRDREIWTEFQDELIDAMIRLEKAFRPFIKE